MSEGSSFLYSHPSLYHVVMRMLYGRYFKARYEALTRKIPAQAEVVEICCGDCYLYRHWLAQKSIRYLGLDLSPQMVSWVQKNGVAARAFNLWTDTIPTAEIIVMQASLYQFAPHTVDIVRRLLASARDWVIIAEPILNLSSSTNPLLAWVSRVLTTPGKSNQIYSGERFTQASFTTLARSFPALESIEVIPGGREMVAVFRIKH